MNGLHLMRPEWLWALVPAVLLALLLWRKNKHRGSWQSVIAPELLQHLVGENAGEKRANLLPLLLLGWMLAVFAASGPSWKKIPQPVHQKQDAMVLVMDLSHSMKSQDLPPSRLDRARQKMLDLLALRKEGQTGLIAYAGDAHIVTPLTDDIPTIANLLPSLHPDMMPLPGSDATSAIAMAIDLLRSAGMREGKILLVTDGVSDAQAQKVRKLIAESGAQLYVLGVGTDSGAPIPLARGGFLKDERGTIVMPTLDRPALSAMASGAGGQFNVIRIDNSDIKDILADNPLQRSQQIMALDRTADTWEDQGYLFILLLLPLALGLFRRGWVLALLPAVLLFPAPRSEAQAWDNLWLTPDQQGQRALQQGEQERAAQLFENPDWAGTAAFNSGDYAAAAEYFGTSDTADSWYNRGNALARAGQLEQAIEAYSESLKRDPDSADAAHNLALVEQLKEQQKQQQQQSQDQDQDQDQEQEQEQNQDQEQDGEQSGQPQQGDNNQDQDPSRENNQDQQQSDSEQNQRQPGQDQQEPSGQEPSEAEENEGQEQAQQQGQAEGQQEGEPTATPITDEERERDQAMEQWLRRVPDDPSGLLREKFRYESRQRQEQGNKSDDEAYW